MAECGLEIVADQRPRHARRLPLAARPDPAVSAARRRATAHPAIEINSIADRALIELGVELEEGELHILGYGVDADDAVFECSAWPSSATDAWRGFT